MRILSLVLALMITVAGFARAQEATDIPEIRDTIAAQMQAFRNDDLGLAFTFASPMIQNRFGDPDRFGAMVSGGYPVVRDPGQVMFHDQVGKDAKVWQRLMVRDGTGTEHWFAYEMIRVDGAWRINGVYPVDAPELST